MLRIAPQPLPETLAATEPAEERGTGRDDVRLMVSRPGSSPDHRRFADLPSLLAPGDALVVNTSATLPAALEAVTADRRAIRLHLSTPIPGGLWVVEPRQPGQRWSSAITLRPHWNRKTQPPILCEQKK